MAICHRELRWKLLEPNRRKAVFLEHAAAALGLENVEVERVRFQLFPPPDPTQIITTRGVALEADSLLDLADWMEARGRLLLFTGAKTGVVVDRSWGRHWKLVADERLAPRFQARLLVLERI
jgi:16S rRNA G527 N7-methylase RsmG